MSLERLGRTLNRPAATWLPSLAVLFTLFVLVLIVGIANARRDGTQNLAGTYKATLEGVGSQASTEIELGLPGRFSGDLGPNPVVRVEIPVVVSPGMRQPALFLQARYAVEVLWDGQRAGGRGLLGGAAVSDRSDRRLIVNIPPELATPGRHVLSLRVEGAWGEGGLFGDLRFGEQERLQERLRRVDLQELGLALGSALLAVLELMVVLRRPDRKDHFLFGLFFFFFAAFMFARSDSYYLFFEELGPRLRLRRLGYLMTTGLVPALVSHFVLDRVGRFASRFLALCGAIAAVALFTPDLRLNELANDLGDLLIPVAIAMSIVLYLVPAYKKDRTPVTLIIGAGLIALVPTLLDIFTTQGLSQQGNFLLPAFFLVVGAIGAGLAVKHTDGFSRYQSLVAGSTDAVLLLDESARVIEANPAACRLLRVEGALGRALGELVTAPAWKLLARHIQDARSDGSAHVECQLRGGDDPLWVDCRTSRLDGGTLLLLLRDISDRRGLEDRLVHAIRLETVGEIARGITHDFNNLLGILLAHLGVLQARAESSSRPEDRENLDRLERMESTIQAAARLTRQLAQAATGGGERRENLSVAELVGAAAALVQSSLPARTSIRIEIEENLPPIEGDPGDLQQGLVNLLLNARDAVAASTERVGEREILVQASSTLLQDSEPAVLICVEDDGPGVPVEDRLRVFDAFYSTKSPSKGTGLGMTMVWKVVREHAGEISVGESASGGASVRLKLPLRKKKTRAPGTRRRGNRVLLVEDDPDLREILRDALIRDRYQVASASGAAQAREMWRAAKGGFDLLVADVVLGSESGLDLATTLELDRPELAVLLISGFLSPEQLPRIEGRSWSLLGKPFRTELLVATVRSLLEPHEPGREASGR